MTPSTTYIGPLSQSRLNKKNPNGTEASDAQAARIECIADLLAKNHFDLSVPELEVSTERWADIGKRAFHAAYTDLATIGRRRTIVVLGAGVSVDAFGNDAFPLGNSAKDEVGRILGVIPRSMWDTMSKSERAKQFLLHDIIQRKKNRLKRLYSYDKADDDLETHLSILADIFEENEVRSAISAVYQDRHRPHLSSALLAHLLKHRFVDAIINFNFDELLDQALEEEIGGGQYHRVISDGDCPPIDDLIIDGRLKVPLYIKPHGTASHPSSLRFTKDHYDQLPEPMRSFLGDVVCGHRKRYAPDTAPPDSTKGVTILSIGFNMESIDLNAILQDAVQRQRDEQVLVFHFNLRSAFHSASASASAAASEDGDDASGNTPPLGGARLEAATGIRARNHIPIHVDAEPGTYAGIANVLRQVWVEVGKRFLPALKPRGIRRHEIVHSLFYKRPSPDRPGLRVPTARRRVPSERDWVGGFESDYAYARLCTELAITLARGNGTLDIETLENGRVGRYAQYLLEVVKQEDHLPERYKTPLDSVLRDFETHGVVVQPASRFTGRLLDTTFARVDVKDLDAVQFDKAIACDLWRALKAVLLGVDNEDLRAHLHRLDDRRMETWFNRLTSSDTRVINPDFKPNALLLLREPDPGAVLHTELSTGLRFVQMIEQRSTQRRGGRTRPDWELLLVVSSVGKLIERYQMHAAQDSRSEDVPSIPPIDQRYFSFIVAETLSRETVTEERFKPHVSSLLGPHNGPEPDPEAKPFFELPYWASRRQMAITLRRHDGSGLWPAEEWPFYPLEAIEFLGAARSRSINPVWVSQPQELQRLVDTFFGYVHVASDFRASRGVPSVTMDEARQTRREHLQAWARQIERQT